jgi:Cd2+/Zn2+-exporting ATPase
VAIQNVTLDAQAPLDETNRKICTDCLRDRLSRRSGIRSVHIDPRDGNGKIDIRLEYDPRIVTLQDLDEVIRAAGACLSDDRASITFRVRGMSSPLAETSIERSIGTLPGVVASASFASKTVRVEFDRRQCALPEIVRRLDQLGIRIDGSTSRRLPVAPAETAAAVRVEAPRPPAVSRRRDVAAKLREYHKLVIAVAGGVVLLAAYLVHVTDGPNAVRLPLVLLSMVLSSLYTFPVAVSTLRQLRFDIDVLMFVAAAGASVLGHFEEGALLLFLFALGTTGEELAMDKARNAIHALAKLAPETAILRLPDGSQRDVGVEILNPGDEIVVRPFDRIAADAEVVSGTSGVDQSPITGESVPVEKSPGSQVFAGTINGEGLLIARVTRASSESTLAKIVRMVNEAQTTKSPTQLFADRVQRFYVPFVLGLTVLLIGVPPMLDGWQWGKWFYRAMAFLTAASPCALAIGTPSAVLSGIARAARLGVLIKGGVHLENLGRVNAIAFDKTGTLTRGKPVVSDVVCFGSFDANELLKLAASVERHSSHPLARAIVDHAESKKITMLEPESLEQLPARGLRATIGARAVAVGKLDLLSPDDPGAPWAMKQLQTLAQEGKTAIVISVDGLLAGVVALIDLARDNAGAAIQALRELGIKRSVMLTGDNEHVARAVASQVGVDEFHAALMPGDKVEHLQRLRDRYTYVAMVGDGVNDAPAMASATVGIAMGGAGTDAAIETADIALMADDLGKLPTAVGLSRFSRKVIAQNLFIALGVIVVLAPLAALGYAYLGVAVMFHEGSTVVVVLNSLRILMYRDR